MSPEIELPVFPQPHSHVFLGRGHHENERRTWLVIGLCGIMMLVEIVGGSLFGSLALVADGLHMSTHAGALLLAAFAYTFARRHANDPSFAFGTGKVGDLAGYTSAIILASIALVIFAEALQRLIHPVAIDFAEAIPIAIVGLMVNVASARLLSGGESGHHHGHTHSDGAVEERLVVETSRGRLALEIFETGMPPHFRIRWLGEDKLEGQDVTVETIRSDGTREVFAFAAKKDLAAKKEFLESLHTVGEPHSFTARLHVAFGQASESHDIAFTEDASEAGAAKIARDNNMRAAFVHVMADAAVSVLVIAGLLLAAWFGWLWMDPVVGIIGAMVIASWSFGLLRDTGAVLLDRLPDRRLADRLRETIEADGDRLADLHLWRLGPGHLGCAASIVTVNGCSAEYYHRKLQRFRGISHATIEVGGG